MDEPTKELVLTLLQEDVREALEAAKGKGKLKVDDTTDHEWVLTEWAQELQHYVTCFQDYRMVTSQAAAVVHDNAALTVAAAEETRAFGDRMTAFQLEERKQSTPNDLLGKDNAAMAGLTVLLGKVATPLEEPSPIKPADILHSEFVIRVNPVAESSKDAAARKLKSQTHLECVACVETKPSYGILKTPCGHCYCRSCINRLVQDSLVDESLFPPRCCRVTIALPSMQGFLNEDVVIRFEEKTAEYSDPNRTYCANMKCLRYIPCLCGARRQSMPCVQAKKWVKLVNCFC
jgi:hypothetical protein